MGITMLARDSAAAITTDVDSEEQARIWDAFLTDASEERARFQHALLTDVSSEEEPTEIQDAFITDMSSEEQTKIQDAIITDVSEEQARIWDEEIYQEQMTQEAAKEWKLKTTSEPIDIINSHKQDNLPKNISGKLGHSNNCLAIKIYKQRLYVAWRSSPMHFASASTKMFIMSAPISEPENIAANQTFAWEKEQEIQLGKDAREPYFMVMNDTLYFYFFQAGTNPVVFQPNTMWRKKYLGALGQWSSEEPWGQLGEVVWQYNKENGTAYSVSYHGKGYSMTSLGGTYLMMNKSSDGVNYEPVNSESPSTYLGGVTEVGWMFDLLGNFWGVLRNENGDKSGWGSRIVHAEPGEAGNWNQVRNKSDREIYESPRMFRHGNDLYLHARTDPDGPFMNHEVWQAILPAPLHHLTDLIWFSLRRHSNAIFKLNKRTAQLEKVVDIPGCGDTSFASIVRLSKHKYLLANYSSPTKWCKFWSWFHGQISPEGTAVYFMNLEFVEDDGKEEEEIIDSWFDEDEDEEEVEEEIPTE